MITSKGDRFISKDRYQTFLNKKEFTWENLKQRRFSSSGVDTAEGTEVNPMNMTLEWAQDGTI